MFEDLYFAYGSNMEPERMQSRCPGAKAEGTALLTDWEVRIGLRGVATIVESPDAETWGVLWAVTPSDVRSLDQVEGVARGLYSPASVDVRGPEDVCTARIYIEKFKGDGRPRPGYLQIVLDGARHFDLPTSYRARLAGLGN